MRVEEPAPSVALLSSSTLPWPDWTPTSFSQFHPPKSHHGPSFISLPEGEIATFGPEEDQTESFVVTSHREKNQKPGIFQFRLCFLPDSIFAGPSPLTPNTNVLRGRGQWWEYSAYDLRSTFFNALPAKTETAKGTILYRTSIMLLSIAEKRLVNQLRKRGWHVLVALPPDSLYRSKLPAMTTDTFARHHAVQLLAEDMDRHYAEQAYSTRAALAYLRHSRPHWLHGKKVLIGTSAGTFGLPAEVLMNPDWDSLVIISGGTNLLDAYEKGAAGVFRNTLNWVKDARQDPPARIKNIPTDEQYHQLYRAASERTRLHSGNTASRIRDHRILMISGRFDRILPAEQVADYHLALGRPERWTYPVGHHLIAVKMAFEVGKLDRWLSKE